MRKPMLFQFTLLALLLTQSLLVQQTSAAPKASKSKQNDNNQESNQSSNEESGSRTGNDKKKDENDPALKCQANYGLEYQQNMISELTFCYDHAGRTCCAQNDTQRIKGKVGHTKVKTEVSDQCISATAKALCSYCDGDIGLGKSSGVCQNYCENWYQQCKNDYFDPYLIQTASGGGETLPFCLKDSLICSQVSDIVDHDSIKFCNVMGVKVHDDRDYNSASCFEGQTSASKYGNLKRKRNPNDDKSTVEDVTRAVRGAYEKLWNAFLSFTRRFVSNPYQKEWQQEENQQSSI
eukprot:403371133